MSHCSFLLRLAITDPKCQWTPENITCAVCGVTKSSVSEPESVWSADAREVLEPCSVIDDSVALQEQKYRILEDYLEYLIVPETHSKHLQVNLNDAGLEVLWPVSQSFFY